MWDIERFTADCRDALAEKNPQGAVRDLLVPQLERPAGMIAALGEPERAGVYRLHVTPELTLLNVVWGPRMTLLPHNHNMWALIGIYTGREDNIYWRRVAGDPQGRIEAAGAKALGGREVLTLGRDIIHSVTNPLDRLTGAIHIYGGEFFQTPRSEWEPEHLTEQPYDVPRNMARFEESNRLLAS